MKNILILFVIIISISCNPTSNDTNNKLPETVKFEADTISFPQIPIGTDITRTIRFENTSELPVKIKNAGAECGCTTVDYDKHVIKPGQFGEVKVTYSNKEDSTTVLKAVIIELNTQNPYHTIYLKAVKDNSASL